jgi:hypothetical protein
MGRVRIRPLRRLDLIATSTRRARPSPGVVTDQGTLGRHGPETPLEALWGALTARVRALSIRVVFEPIKFAPTTAGRLSRPSAASRTVERAVRSTAVWRAAAKMGAIRTGYPKETAAALLSATALRLPARIRRKPNLSRR